MGRGTGTVQVLWETGRWHLGQQSNPTSAARGAERERGQGRIPPATVQCQNLKSGTKRGCGGRPSPYLLLRGGGRSAAGRSKVPGRRAAANAQERSSGAGRTAAGRCPIPSSARRKQLRALPKNKSHLRRICSSTRKTPPQKRKKKRGLGSHTSVQS